jgi:two-component system response regulator YesN
MYRVLLVDDEPLMLSRIKRLVDWGANDCLVVATASNGVEALEKLNQLGPDLVICDIAMPGFSGLELLKWANAEYPDMVFIMLTNHADFELARESLRYRAVEYLIKNNLEQETVEKALARAVTERKNRNKLHSVSETDEYIQAKQRQNRIRNILTRYLQADEKLKPDDMALLTEEGMLSRFAFAFIPLNFTVIPEYSTISEDERHNLFEWETEIAERLASAFFPHVLLLPHSTINTYIESLLLFVWGIPAEIWETGSAKFRERLIKTSGQLIRLGVDVLPSSLYETLKVLESPAKVIASLEKQYYFGKRGTHSEILEKARQYIVDNVDKRILLQDVANCACISPGYLSTLFKKEHGQNMVDFINHTKIDRACDLLRTNKYRINEIADMLAFENAFYFTKVFRKHTGLTPSEYHAKITGGGGGGLN